MSLELKVEELKKIRVSKKDKKNKSLDQWAIRLPLNVQTDMNIAQIVIDNKIAQIDIDDKIPSIDNHDKENNTQNQKQSIQQLLDQFINQLIQQKHCSQTLNQILNQAQTLTLSQLWNLQYTNKLSLCTQIINKTYNTFITPTQKIFDNQNKDQNNLNSQQQNDHNNKKKKKKIKKSLHKKTQSIQPKNYHNNKQTPQQLNLSNEINKPLYNKQTIQKTLTLNHTFQKIQKEILRVENLLIQEIQNIHILPYLQAQQKILQSQSKLINKNINKLNPQKMYHLEAMEKDYQNNKSFMLPNQQNSNLNNRQNINFPLLNYDYQMGHNAQMGQFQYQMTEQHIKSFGIPMMPINSNFVQHLGQLNAQYIPVQQVFYGQNSVINRNVDLSRGVMKKGQIDNKKGIQMIDIDEDDVVQQIGK